MLAHQVVIVGAGFAGLCMAIKLKQAGIEDFVILEKAADLGGTWRDNVYPGAACDIPSALYSYSFELSSSWRYKWSRRSQIHQYQHATAEKYGLSEHFRYQQELASADYDEARAHWHLRTQEGVSYYAQHWVSAVGQLHLPAEPVIKGGDQYTGQRFHSARWREDLDLQDMRVAVIGNAASAVQLVPEIAPKCRQLTVFQRSPNWMFPKVDREYSGWEQRLYDKIPALARFYRHMIWLFGEWLILPAIQGRRVPAWLVRTVCLRNMRKHVRDPKLRRSLTPDYPVGAKRILFCDDYYPALLRTNVSLETNDIECFTSSGLRTTAGLSRSFDVVIYATGFTTNPFLANIEVRGVGGRSLHTSWEQGAQAYLGVATHGFPNLHFMYGPNTNLAHSSILIMLEAQADYIIERLKYGTQNEISAMDVRAEIEAEYNEELQAQLSKLAFQKVANSWYKVGDRITNNWAGSTSEYRARLRNFKPQEFIVVSR